MLQVLKVTRETDVCCTSGHHVSVIVLPLRWVLKLVRHKRRVNTFYHYVIYEAVEVSEDQTVVRNYFVKVLKQKNCGCWGKDVVRDLLFVPVIVPQIFHSFYHSRYLHFAVDCNVIFFRHTF
jgi:hypothetical protein